MNEHFLTQPEGNAIVYCEGAFQTTYGKTAHGLVRFTRRYKVLSVVDSQCAGQDTGEILDNKPNGILIYASIREAIDAAAGAGVDPTHLVIGMATDGGRLDHWVHRDIKTALKMGLNVDCGLHEFITEDPELVELAAAHQVQMRDIRKPPPRSHLHFFSGKIEKVTSLKIAVLGTDSTVGKRTTAWFLVQGLEAAGYRAQMIGTGQTAWMQGARYSVVFDSLVNDFVSGEIEHAVWSAWNDTRPDVIVIEGQGSLMNPAFPGGFEILAAGRPDVVILQHAPARKEYDGFPGYPIQPLKQQIGIIEQLSGKKVIAVTINHENIPQTDIPDVCNKITQETGLPAYDLLTQGINQISNLIIKSYFNTPPR